MVATAANNDIMGLHELLQKGMKINSMDPRTGRTALHESCLHGYQGYVNTLFKAGVNVHLRTRFGRETALHLAVRGGFDVIVRMLLKRGLDPGRTNRQGLAAIHLVRSEAVAHVLLEEGVDSFQTTSDGKSASELALKRGDEMVAVMFMGILEKKMRKEHAIEREHREERKKKYFLQIAQEKKERAERKRTELKRQYLKFRWR